MNLALAVENLLALESDLWIWQFLVARLESATPCWNRVAI